MECRNGQIRNEYLKSREINIPNFFVIKPVCGLGDNTAAV